MLRRLLSLMDGRHGGMRAGRGGEFLDMAEYRPGDDVKDIDWKATARSGRTVIKRFEATATMQVVLVVDIGRSMGATAPSGETKEEVALEACATIAWLAILRGDQVGLVAGDAGRLRQMPARTGNAHVDLMMRRMAEDIDLTAPPSDVTRILKRAGSATRRRSLIVVVTDHVHPLPDAEPILTRLATKHEVIVLSVEDVDPTSFHEGTQVVDVDDGPLPDYVLRDQVLGDQSRATVERTRSEVSAMLARRGIRQVSLSSSDGVPRALIDALERTAHVR